MLPPDHRLLHLQAESPALWLHLPPVSPSTCPSPEPFERAVSLLDGPRCAERAVRMKASHAMVVSDLDAPGLDLALLTRWQKVACPQARLRTEPWAYAKGGAERYSLDHDGLEQRLATPPGDVSPLQRSLRAYLDLLFFHPFSDGNSRAARLAFHFLSARGGLEFRLVDPLFRLSLPAGNVRAYQLFAQLAARLLAGPRPLRP